MFPLWWVGRRGAGRFSDDRLEKRDHLRRIPFGGTDESADLAPLAIDQDRGWQADDAEFLKGLAADIELNCEALDADLAIELAHRIGAAAIDRERYHRKVRSAEQALQPRERRHLLPARDAPRRPH